MCFLKTVYIISVNFISSCITTTNYVGSNHPVIASIFQNCYAISDPVVLMDQRFSATFYYIFVCFK